MNKLLAFLAFVVLSAPVLAADTACLTQAAEKKLSGAAQTAFVRKCVRDSCESAMLEKKLAGAAKTSSMKKCVGDGLAPLCEGLAASKKLGGAAKTSFLKKCQSGE